MQHDLQGAAFNPVAVGTKRGDQYLTVDYAERHAFTGTIYAFGRLVKTSESQAALTGERAAIRPTDDAKRRAFWLSRRRVPRQFAA